MDRAISEFSSYTLTENGQMLVLDTTTSTTKRMLVSDFATYVLDSVASFIEGGDHQSVYLSDQDINGGNATTP
mgnify:FL=1|tara:strand:- start:268 stop:486 length:219 start_codon:yes stop_codon:yes gene_type:complete